MAKRKVNKSQLIRDYHNANPAAGPSEIARALAEQGQKVSIALVSQAIRGAKMPGRPRGRPRKNAILPVEGANLVGQMILAADFSRSCGGIDAAIGALQALKKISEKMSS